MICQNLKLLNEPVTKNLSLFFVFKRYFLLPLWGENNFLVQTNIKERKKKPTPKI